MSSGSIKAKNEGMNHSVDHLFYGLFHYEPKYVNDEIGESFSYISLYI